MEMDKGNIVLIFHTIILSIRSLQSYNRKIDFFDKRLAKFS